MTIDPQTMPERIWAREPDKEYYGGYTKGYYLNSPISKHPEERRAEYIRADLCQPAQEWFPIETAPRDGTWVLIRFEDTDIEQSMVTAKWVKNSYHPSGEWVYDYWDSEWRSWVRYPTHWMPLPQLPKTGGE